MNKETAKYHIAAKYHIGDKVSIISDGKKIDGKIDEIVLFRRENKIGYRFIDDQEWAWYYVGESEVKK